MLLFLNYKGVSQSSYPEIFNSILHQPEVIHYHRSDFQGDTEFWSACRGNDGVLYFGNNDGVLIYNGESWQKVKLPNSSSVRSLLASSDGTIYAGGYNEFGNVVKDSLGKYHYNSFIEKLNLKGKELENLEQAHEIDSNIILRFYKELIVMNENRKTVIPSSTDFMCSAVIGNTYYVQDMGVGILSFHPDNDDLSLVFQTDKLKSIAVKGILPTNGASEVFIVLENGEVFKGNLDTKEVVFWENLFSNGQKDQVLSAIKKGNSYLIGTLGSRIKTLNANGKLVTGPDAYNRLQNPSVLNLLSVENGLWVMLYNGLDYINYDTSSYKFFDSSKVYDIKLFHQQLYISTNKGVYVSDFRPEEPDKITFKVIDGLQGQAWTFNEYKGDLLIAHHKGLFRLIGKEAKQITSQSAWKVIEIPNKENELLACGYAGLSLIRKEGNEFTLVNKIKGFEESTRDIIASKEENTFWVCHGYKGVFKIKINDDYNHVYAIDHYTDNNGFESPFNINVFKWEEDIVFTTNTGIYTYNENGNFFEPYDKLNSILDNTKNTRKILQKNDTTWAVEDNGIVYFVDDSAGSKLYSRPFLKVKGQLNRGMETIYPLPNNKVLIGTTDGIYLFDLKNEKVDEGQTGITQVSMFNGQRKQLVPLDRDVSELPNATDIIRIEFAAPDLISGSEIEYQYQLEGLNLGWSEWTENNFKEYSHLQPGNYTFNVRSRDLKGIKGKMASFTFLVTPKWYQTVLFKISFVALLIFILWLGYLMIKRNLEKENLKIQEENLKAKKLLELEIERLKLKHDKEKVEEDKKILEKDVIAKSKELANYTMQLVNKKDIVQELQNDLKELRRLVKTQLSRDKISDIFRKLHQHKIGEEYMEVFDVNFENIHHQFFEKLREINPKLSKKDQRLCAFIKMDLTNKEISPLLNISIRGVETLRYRLRKKLNLKTEESLHEFLKDLI
ncbi:triple tyrosine motif-containing protein [Galbibacter mesophilus]|uniref:triple tyrosine motif-containing protein n=1 Tax=Galbibacter mesophilus TaxID=379069 RepID=UPI00191FD189|nr:triple tyrosine motif-containing protein [Galbibacter mesophilus]MCM5664019.1 hypothetical protein [Galbibacter mesophilus]